MALSPARRTSRQAASASAHAVANATLKLAARYRVVGF